MSEELTFQELVSAIERASTELARRAKVAVNASLTVRNWPIGCYIDEYELRGGDRSEYYGERLLPTLAEHLKQAGVRGAAQRQLYRYLTFYRAYPKILPTLSAKSLLTDQGAYRIEILPMLSARSPESEAALMGRLSFSHFDELSGLESHPKRSFYQQQCVKAGWSVRELKRQIATL